MRKASFWILSLSVLLFTAWGMAQLRQNIFRRRAEALYSDINAIEVQHSTASDAHKFMTRWRQWGTSDGDCDAPKGCRFNVDIDDWLFDVPDFVYQDGPHIGARILDHVGLRNSRVSGGFTITNGIITAKEFGMRVALPFGEWQKEQSYWPLLEAKFLEHETLGPPYPDFHAQHVIYMRRIQLETVFTPQESSAERQVLTDFRFNCITQWHPCYARAEIAPGLEKEFTSLTRK
jgi:hypothetical protein